MRLWFSKKNIERFLPPVSIIAVVCLGVAYGAFAKPDTPSVSTGEHFALEPISQAIVPARESDLVLPPKISFDESVFSEDLEFAVRRRDTMQKIAHRALTVFLAEQQMTLEAPIQDSVEEMLAAARASQSLRGVKTVAFTHREIADAIQEGSAALH